MSVKSPELASLLNSLCTPTVKKIPELRIAGFITLRYSFGSLFLSRGLVRRMSFLCTSSICLFTWAHYLILVSLSANLQSICLIYNPSYTDLLHKDGAQIWSSLYLQMSQHQMIRGHQQVQYRLQRKICFRLSLRGVSMLFVDISLAEYFAI